MASLLNRAVAGDSDNAADLLRRMGIQSMQQRAAYLPPITYAKLPEKADSFAWLNNNAPIDPLQVKSSEVAQIVKWLEAGTELAFSFGKYEYRCKYTVVLQIDIYGLDVQFRLSWRTLPANKSNLERFAVYCAMYKARPYADFWFRNSYSGKSYGLGVGNGSWINVAPG
jgi:hypothetical protein